MSGTGGRSSPQGDTGGSQGETDHLIGGEAPTSGKRSSDASDAPGGTDVFGEAVSSSNEQPSEKSSLPRSSSAPPSASTSAPGDADAPGEADDLKRIRGIGPQNEERLRAIGVTRFVQIAAWTPEDEHEIGVKLAFPGRIEREEWVAQARRLAAGEATDFSTRVDAGEVRTSLDRDDPRYSEH